MYVVGDYNMYMFEIFLLKFIMYLENGKDKMGDG